MAPVRAALIGAGLVGQVAHLHTLTRPNSPITLAGIVDASASRAQQLAERYEVPWGTDLSALPIGTLDAVVIAAPDPAHRSLTVQALNLGLHVFIEKPLGLSVAECEAMESAASEAQRVCQVGYMKRFDPAVTALQQMLSSSGTIVEGIGVEVRDPDASPFVKDFPFVPAGSDMPPSLIADGSARFTAVVESLLGRPAQSSDITTYTSYISSLIHDLNLVRLLLPEADTVESGFAAMEGGQVGLHLRAPDGRLARITHTQQPTIADYHEQLLIYTNNGIYELTFPAPYLLHAPTRLRHIELKDAEEISLITDLNASTEEAFELELDSFAAAIDAGRSEPFANSFADATIDLRVIEQAYLMAVRR